MIAITFGQNIKSMSIEYALKDVRCEQRALSETTTNKTNGLMNLLYAFVISVFLFLFLSNFFSRCCCTNTRCVQITLCFQCAYKYTNPAQNEEKFVEKLT